MCRCTEDKFWKWDVETVRRLQDDSDDTTAAYEILSCCYDETCTDNWDWCPENACCLDETLECT